MNIPGPSNNFLPFPVDPSLGIGGWASLFSKASDISGFSTGPGTLWPFPSMPISQAFRYFFAAKQWRIMFDISQVVDDGGDEEYINLDTGFIPYGCGYDGFGDTGAIGPLYVPVPGGGVSEQAFALSRPSPTLALAERLASANGLATGNTANPWLTAQFYGVNSFSFSPDTESAGPYVIGLGPTGVFFPATGRRAPCVLDATIPGNCFLPFLINPFNGTSFNLDGMSVSVPLDPDAPWTGSITITTKDT